jgi:magnesium transporter
MPETIETGQTEHRSLMDLISANDLEAIEGYLGDISPVEVARDLSWLDKADQTRLIEILGPEKSAGILSKISGIGGDSIVRELPLDKAGSIVNEFSSDKQANVLRQFEDEQAETILGGIAPKRAQEIRKLLSYPENTAGAMMTTDFLSYSGGQSVKNVLDDLRRYGEEYSDYDIQYAYVTSDTGKLLGVLRLRDLLMAPRNKKVSDIMIKEPKKVDAHDSLTELRDFFRDYTFLGVPVTDEEGNLVGVVSSASVRDAANKRNNQLFLKFAGIVGGEEFRTMPVFKRSSRRLSWLSINIVLNIIAASVIALYQDTLEKAIVLAVFLPIISDMSGCSGNQAVAVSIRELTLGLVRPREILRVLTKEAVVGIMNGIILGCLLGGAAILWKGNPYLGLVVGVSLAANTLVAVSFGGLVPLILRGMRTDPALASGPLLTTITDMCGFFFVLSFASLLLPRLS